MKPTTKRHGWPRGFWRADLENVAALEASAREYGMAPWRYYFTGLTWSQSGFGVIRRERVSNGAGAYGTCHAHGRHAFSVGGLTGATTHTDDDSPCSAVLSSLRSCLDGGCTLVDGHPGPHVPFDGGAAKNARSRKRI